MKKSLIALAVLAASGASFAQSSVTIYGLVDAAYAHDSGNNGYASNNRIISGGVDTSRFGFKGSEDLGGGLKANFKLENGFNVDTGAAGTAGLSFNRYAYVGFSGGFGEVKIGKTGTAYDDVDGASDPVFAAGALSPMNIVFLSNNLYNWNAPNSIYYATPSFSGFSGAVSYSLDENKTAQKVSSFNVKYEGGPLALSLGYQAEDPVGGLLAGQSSMKFTRLNAAYDLKVVKLLAAYGKVTNVANVSGADAKEWLVGADYPVSSALTVSGGYARSVLTSSAPEITNSVFSLGAKYALSARTYVYTGFEADKSESTTVDNTHNRFAAGIHHTF